MSINYDELDPGIREVVRKLWWVISDDRDYGYYLMSPPLSSRDEAIEWVRGHGMTAFDYHLVFTQVVVRPKPRDVELIEVK